MTKNDVGPIAEFGAAVRHFAGEQASKTVVAGSERIAGASSEEVATWLKEAVDRLDATVDEGARAQIMEQMGLNCAEMNKSHVEQALARRNRFDTFEAFLHAEETTPSRGTRLVRAGDLVYQYYEPWSAFGRRCFCSLWHGLPEGENVSPTWCQCSRAFVSQVWKAYTGRPVRVDLVESCISGAHECKFVIHLDT
jgi:hypothetical protein